LSPSVPPSIVLSVGAMMCVSVLESVLAAVVRCCVF
jgi:hypothetical protein